MRGIDCSPWREEEAEERGRAVAYGVVEEWEKVKANE